jgi:phage recombination protein Bet
MSKQLTTTPTTTTLPITGGKPSALAIMASRFDMEPAKLMDTLKATVFKGASNEQLAALVVVANEHGLNPFTREIYAFPDKGGGIQAVIGVDGWIRIITQHPSFDGFDHQFEGEGNDLSCTVTLYRKDISRPVKVTEYLSECRRGTEPWKQYPKRMLRHKALIQAGRIAFGLGSLKDEDDVATVRDVTPPPPANVPKVERRVEPPALTLDASEPDTLEQLRGYLQSVQVEEATFLQLAAEGGMFLDADVPLANQPEDVLRELFQLRSNIMEGAK